jgi:hypothetical protein
MTTSIRWDETPTAAVGRNGIMQCHGVAAIGYVFVDDKPVNIRLQPYTSRGDLGRCEISIPLAHAADVAEALREEAKLPPSLGMDDLIFLVMGDNHCWGSGADMPTALKNAQRPRRWVAYLAPKDSYISEMGDLVYAHRDAPPREIMRRGIPKPKKPKKPKEAKIRGRRETPNTDPGEHVASDRPAGGGSATTH